jgi:alkanesulfonate monooxygenase SsuD/methylene tetrahydromethanopterin reductase-like flavin-dependent oxidoreductase (luciferase family)
MHTMQFGLFGGASAQPTDQTTDSSQGLDAFVDYVCGAERMGFDSVFLVEHHFMGTGQISASLSLLTYLAAKTNRIRLGTGVVVLPWHNPVLLAEQVATLDQLSKGRFDFGIGKGYRPNEFAGFGISREEAAARYDEIVAFLRAAWNGETRFSHHGQFWNYDDIAIDPPVVQKPHPPMWVGAASADSIRRAAEQGMSLLLDQIAVPAVVGERIALYRRSAEAAGLAFRPGSVGVTRALHLVRTDAERQEAFRSRAKLVAMLQKAAGEGASSFANSQPTTYSDSSLTVDEAALIGYPEEVADKIRLLQTQGVDNILLADVSGHPENLSTFAEVVMPQFKSTTSEAVDVLDRVMA